MEAIAAHRRPLTERLYEGIRELGYEALTPQEQGSPIAAFTRADMSPLVQERFRARQIQAGIDESFIRIAPSVFNVTDDVKAFLRLLGCSARREEIRKPAKYETELTTVSACLKHADTIGA